MKLYQQEDDTQIILIRGGTAFLPEKSVFLPDQTTRIIFVKSGTEPAGFPDIMEVSTKILACRLEFLDNMWQKEPVSGIV